MIKTTLWTCLVVNNVALALAVAFGGVYPRRLHAQAYSMDSCCSGNNCNNQILIETGGSGGGDGCTKNGSGNCTGGTCIYCNGSDTTNHCALATNDPAAKCVKYGQQSFQCGNQVPMGCKAGGGGGTSGCCPPMQGNGGGQPCQPTECDNSSSTPC